MIQFSIISRSTDGSHGDKGMGAGFYHHDTIGGWYCNVRGGSGGGSSGRAEFAAACLALEDSLLHSRPIAILTDSKGLMTFGSNCVGEGKEPLLRPSPDGDILGCIIELLRIRVEPRRDLFTIFMKIRAHREELFNDKAHRWADEGRDALFLARLRFCAHYCIDRDAVQKKRTALRTGFWRCPGKKPAFGLDYLPKNWEWSGNKTIKQMWLIWRCGREQRTQTQTDRQTDR